MIFVLGAKGFAGSAVLDVLRGLDECTGIDLDNYEAHAGKPCDILVNANGNSEKFLSDEQPALDFDLSVRSVVRALTDFPAPRCIHLSSVDVYTSFADPARTSEEAAIDTARQSRYGFHKWLAEQCVMKAQTRWLILRLGGMVGPGLRKGPVYDLMHDTPLRVHPDSRYQYIPTRTVGEAIAHFIAAGSSTDVFNVTATGTVSLRQVAAWLGKPVTVDPAAAQCPPQHYEINNAKLRAVMAVPATEDAVREFLRTEGG